MEDIEKAVNEIDLDDLWGGELCYFCVAFGMSIEDSLHSRDNLHEGPISSDRKCPHCYDTEEEFGRLKLTKEERKYASHVLMEFEEYRKKRLEICA